MPDRVSDVANGAPAARSPRGTARVAWHTHGSPLAVHAHVRLHPATLACVLSAQALAACGPDVREARQLPAAARAGAAAVVQSNTELAVDIYRTLASAPDTPANFFFSPFSVSTLLAMLDAGAAGTTDTQLRAAMHATLDTAAMNAAYRALLASLAIGTSYGGYKLQIADRLFGQQGFAFLAPFLATTKTDFGAPLMPVDFVGDRGGAAQAIDSWVSTQTAGAIPTLFTAQDFDTTTRLVAANAIHFQGTWHTQFEPASDGVFTRLDGSTVTTPLMSKHGDPITLGDIPGVATVGALPFAGEDLSFVIFQPDGSGGLPTLEGQLTADALSSWLAAPTSVSGGVDITMPKFQLDSTVDLPGVLAALGVTDAFSPTVADFSGMDGSNDLWVEKMQHEATVTVEESGATAAAVSVSTNSSVNAVPTPLCFDVDSPFMFAIVDNVTGAVLFMGRLEDPSLSAGP